MFHRAFFKSAGLVSAASLGMLLSAATTVEAATYYVSPNGSDGNRGTAAGEAWKTLSRVNSQKFQAGDAILLEGGAQFEGTLHFKGTPRSSMNRGTALRPIVVGSYGTGRAQIRAGRGSGIVIEDTAGFRIRDLIVAGDWNADTQAGNNGRGVMAYCGLGGSVKLNYVRIENVDISGFKSAGIEVSAWPSDGTKSGFSNVSILRSSVHDNGEAGITSFGYWNRNSTQYAHQNFYIGHTTVYNNQGITNSGKHSGNGIVLSDVNGAVVERNVSHDNGMKSNWSSGGPVGIWAWDANNVKIQCNEAYNNRSMTLDGGGFDLDGGCTNSILQYNYSHDNVGSGYLLAQFADARPFHGNVVRYNISENDGRRNGYAGLHVWNGGSGISNCEIYNNTVFLSPSALGGTPCAVRVDSATTNVKFRNNILVTTGGLPLLNVAGGQTGLEFQGNDYWTGADAFQLNWQGASFGSLAQWQNAVGQEKVGSVSTGLNVDPLLNAPGTGGTLIGGTVGTESLTAYRLKSASSLRQAGLDLEAVFGTTVGGRDFFGNLTTSTATSSIGAHDAAAEDANTP